MIKLLDQVWSFTERTLKETYRNKIALFWDIVFPIFWYFLTFYLFMKPNVPSEFMDVVGH